VTVSSPGRRERNRPGGTADWGKVGADLASFSRGLVASHDDQSVLPRLL